MPLFLIVTRWARRLRLNRFRVLLLLGFATSVLIFGAILFSITEDVSLGIGLYWAVTTATTVGYGDVTPHNTAARIVAMLVMLGTIPAVGAVFALAAGASVVSHMRRMFGMDGKLPSSSYTAVYGTHPVITRVLDELASCGDEVVLVAPTRPPELADEHHFLSGDPTDESVIRASHPERADRALIACQNDADTLVVAVGIHSIAPSLETYALTQSPSVARALGELGVTHTLASDQLIGHTLAKSLETPQAGDVLLSLVDSNIYRMVQAEVTEDLVSQPLSVARGRADTFVLGVYRNGKVDLGVNDDPILTPDDRLIMVHAAG